MAEWSVQQTHNPVDAGSSPAPVTCSINFVLGHSEFKSSAMLVSNCLPPASWGF